MRDYPPDYLKTICTIDPLGSHRLLFTIYKKMNQTLKEFYSQDASYKALSAEDQIRLFGDWAAKKKINLQLSFKRRSQSKWLRALWMLLAVVYLLSYITKKGTEYTGYLFPIILVLQMALYTQSPI